MLDLDLEKIKSQLNLENFEASQIPQMLSQYSMVVWFVFLIGALITAGVLFNTEHTKEQALHAQISQEQAKIALMKSRDAAIQDFNNFKSSLKPEINEVQLIKEISDDANLYHITFTSLKPGQSQNLGLYDAINVNFSAVASNFKDTMLFLRKIEKSPTPLRVNSWSGNEGADGKITSNLEVSAVHIHP